MRLLALLVSGAAWCGATHVASASAAGPALEEGFAEPPEETKPWCYWYWLSGHITKEGITKDLESIAFFSELLYPNPVSP